MKIKNQLSAFKRILKYIYKYKFIFILSLFSALIVVVGTLLIPINLGYAIDYIIDAGNVNFGAMQPILLKIGILILMVGVFQWLMNTLNNKLAYNITYSLRKDAFNKILNLPLKYIDKYPYGEIVSKIMGDVEQLGDGLLMGFTQLFTGIATIIGVLICIFLKSKLIALIVLLLTPISLFIAKFISQKTSTMFKEQACLKAEQSAFIEETISNQKVLKSYNQENNNSLKFSTINKKLETTSLKAIFFSSITNPATRFVNAIIYATIVLIGSLLIQNNNIITVGTLNTLLAFVNQYTKPFNEISGVFTEFQNTLVCSQRIFDLLDEPEEVDSTIDTLSNATGEIKLENVYFSYTPEQKLIEDFNLTVKPGQKIAIVGPTGCGKTTLINLLMRFYDVTDGKISLDGKNIKDLSRNNLRENYGMVLQETFLKSGTIKDNITLGKPDATMEEIISASKLAYSYDFIEKLPNGFDTYIGENGGNLSQGQKQLLCITRIMLCHPPILILDEATSNIDTRTEMKIQDAFHKLMENKTSFIVAHRLSTIQNVDIILVMKNGNIIEQGNHEELLEKHGFYYELYNSQFK